MLTVSQATHFNWKKKYATLLPTVTKRIREICEAQVCYGYRRVHVLLGREGWGSQISKNLYTDGFLTLGAGRNTLNIADDILGLEGTYTSRTMTFGAAVSGLIERGTFEVLPELAFSYGKTWIGDMALTGRAYGVVDNTLSLDAGAVTLADITFRPEFRFALDGGPVADASNVFSLTPRFICQQIRTTTVTEACGGGAEFGISGQSADGQTSYTASLIADRIGNRTETSVKLGYQRRF